MANNAFFEARFQDTVITGYRIPRQTKDGKDYVVYAIRIEMKYLKGIVWEKVYMNVSAGQIPVLIALLQHAMGEILKDGKNSLMIHRDFFTTNLDTASREDVEREIDKL